VHTPLPLVLSILQLPPLPTIDDTGPVIVCLPDVGLLRHMREGDDRPITLKRAGSIHFSHGAIRVRRISRIRQYLDVADVCERNLGELDGDPRSDICETLIRWGDAQTLFSRDAVRLATIVTLMQDAYGSTLWRSPGV
jgi:hypothetical protein